MDLAPISHHVTAPYKCPLSTTKLRCEKVIPICPTRPPPKTTQQQPEVEKLKYYKWWQRSQKWAKQCKGRSCLVCLMHAVHLGLGINQMDKTNNKLGWAGPHSSSKLSLSSKRTQMFWVQQILGKQRFCPPKRFCAHKDSPDTLFITVRHSLYW